MTLTNLIGTIKLPFRKERKLCRSFYEILGFYPNKLEYYQQALLHKSLSLRNDNGPLNNERLEFLGDAILGAVVGDIVYKHFQKKREGFLTTARSKIVQRETLGKLAVEIGLDKLIQRGNYGQSHNSYLAGNAFEALLGAVYLDKGYPYCMKFIEQRILNQLIDIDKIAYREVNFKSRLLEWTQKNHLILDFKLIEEERDGNGSPIFEYQTIVEGVQCATGRGYTKKQSQQMACKETIKALKSQKELKEIIFKNKEARTAMEESPVMEMPNIETEGQQDESDKYHTSTIPETTA